MPPTPRSEYARLWVEAVMGWWVEAEIDYANLSRDFNEAKNSKSAATFSKNEAQDSNK